MIRFKDKGNGTVECRLDLEDLYTDKELEKFNKRWEEFFASDEANASVLKRKGNSITYSHKSWIPSKKNKKPSVLMLFGNPAPHSVRDDIYFSYEGNGQEHRFWKVLRELGFVDMRPDVKNMKKDFFNLNYNSPFRLGFEVLYTFPSSASKPKWSGVAGLEKLFGKRAIQIIQEEEKKRLLPLIKKFIQSEGAIVVFQKDAYSAVAHNEYNLTKAVEGKLRSSLDGIPVYGTPPTRWLYTAKMKNLLTNIKNKILTV